MYDTGMKHIAGMAGADSALSFGAPRPSFAPSAAMPRRRETTAELLDRLRWEETGKTSSREWAANAALFREHARQKASA